MTAIGRALNLLGRVTIQVLPDVTAARGRLVSDHDATRRWERAVARPSSTGTGFIRSEEHVQGVGPVVDEPDAMVPGHQGQPEQVTGTTGGGHRSRRAWPCR